MNREKFVGRLIIALVLVMFAAIAGEVRRVQKQEAAHERAVNNHYEQLAEMWSEEQPHGDVGCTGRFGETASEPEVLVRFKAGTSDEEIERLTLGFNDEVEDRIEAVNNLVAIDDLDNADVAATVAQYSALPSVEYAEANNYISLEPNIGGRTVRENRPVAGAPDDALFAYQWALDNRGQSEGKSGSDVRAIEAWKTSHGSNDVVVAVLDSGVYYTHEDLAANMWLRPASVAEYEDNELGLINDVNGFNAIDNSGDPMDDNGHGTHCAGIIGAVGNNSIGVSGINWRVSIMPLKFLSRNGYGSTKDAIEAINYVINRKQAGVNVRVISASWGSTRGSKALADVIKKAHENDILFVAAAGNSSANTDKQPHYPANDNFVMSVAALNRKGALASFSNFGKKTVHLAAPGAEILSTWLGNEYFEASGTSMATPYVSGVAGLVLAENKDLSVEDLRRRLLSNVDKSTDLESRVASGGSLNAARAVAGK